jgi:hypothetical protein
VPNGTGAFGALSAGGIVKATATSGALGLAVANTDYLTPASPVYSGLIKQSNNPVVTAGTYALTSLPNFAEIGTSGVALTLASSSTTVGAVWTVVMGGSFTSTITFSGITLNHNGSAVSSPYTLNSLTTYIVTQVSSTQYTINWLN